jgi:hypothetical protein
VSIAVTT